MLLTELESNIGYSFTDISLLETALTHSSYANEHDAREFCSNERLEFLGDAVLGMEVALLIYEKGTDLSEGKMTRIRAALVRTESLAETARNIGLDRFLKLGVGADKTAVRKNDSAMEDAFEAMVAAVFLDGGVSAARELVHRCFSKSAENLIRDFPDNAACDYKSRLQIILQAKGPADIQYVPRSESGPDHDKLFTVAIKAGNKILGTGEGKTKKIAEQQAAKMALEGLTCT